MIYSFFEPDDDAAPGLGTYIILDHIVRAGRAGLPYVYLGYWVEEARSAWPTSRVSARSSGSARRLAPLRPRAAGAAARLPKPLRAARATTGS